MTGKPRWQAIPTKLSVAPFEEFVSFEIAKLLAFEIASRHGTIINLTGNTFIDRVYLLHVTRYHAVPACETFGACHERRRKPTVLYRRWEKASRSHAFMSQSNSLPRYIEVRKVFESVRARCAPATTEAMRRSEKVNDICFHARNVARSGNLSEKYQFPDVERRGVGVRASSYPILQAIAQWSRCTRFLRGLRT
jgi:hypothetical protein